MRADPDALDPRAFGPAAGAAIRFGMGRGGPLAQRIPAMGKEKNKGGKEAKKPKKEVPKILATANSNSGKDGTVIAGKKVKQ